MLGVDFPDPSLLHERVLGDLAAHFGTLAKGAGKRKLANSCLCALAVVGHVNHVLVQEVFRDFALTQTGRTVDVKATAYVVATDVDAALRYLTRPLRSEESGSVVPLPLVAVEAVRVLQILDRVGILESCELRVERGGFGLQSCSGHGLESAGGLRPVTPARVVIGNEGVAGVDLVAR